MKAPRVLAIFGDIDPQEAKALANQYLGTGEKLPAIEANPVLSQTLAATPPAGEPSVNVRRVEVQKTAQPLAGVVIGYDADTVIGEPANYPLAVADTMTSGYTYPTGYLHEILRGRGLVYVVHAVNQPGRGDQYKGTFLVYAGCDPRNVNEVVDVILQNIARVQGTAQDVQPQWFDRSKQLITISDAMSNETPSEQASTAALDELYGMGYDHHDLFAGKINAVTLDQVRDVSSARLKNCVVTISTPMPEAVKIETGTRTYSSFPQVDLTPRGVQHDNGGGE
jgi:zinc protease